ncbi:MAG: tRNA (guanosine(46)-N7)-methyltransferase TrmB [Candidatus Nanopelagicales bacterium]|nr:tRNA (guanosine(46)-N7)-methyltransferase TrmB [Candidatus Nanopelagicales bacterium]
MTVPGADQPSAVRADGVGEGVGERTPPRPGGEQRGPAADRRIRTFHPRRSRTTPSAASALTRLLPAWGVDAEEPPAHLSDLFDPPRPVVLEIGSGMGEATLQMAAADPGHGIVAVDVHTPGIGALLAGAERAGLANVRVCVGDAVELMDHLAPASLVGIRAFFPDPWPKVRHHKRRLVQPAFVHRAATLLVPGGTLHLATDIPDYAERMLAVCAAEALLVNRSGGFVPRPDWRPVTGYERRGLVAGRPSVDLILERR